MTGRGFNFRHKDRSRRAVRSPVRVGQEGTSETKLRSRFTRSHDFVFATFVGTPLDPGNFVRREFRPALARAGLTFRFHDLRHFAVSALIAEGADIKLLQAIVGHASADHDARYLWPPDDCSRLRSGNPLRPAGPSASG